MTACLKTAKMPDKPSIVRARLSGSSVSSAPFSGGTPHLKATVYALTGYLYIVHRQRLPTLLPGFLVPSWFRTSHLL
jgi:hypothetical protein